MFSVSLRQAIIDENYRFERVIPAVADVFKRCGFFKRADWQNLLINGFERERLGLTSGEIQLHMAVVSDNSFVNGLAPQSTSTPIAAGGTGQKENQKSRNKRLSTTIRDDRQGCTQKKCKKASSSLDEVEAAKILVDLQKADWGQILPAVNEKQNAVKYVNVFEKSKQLKGISTPVRYKLSDVGSASRTINLRDQNQATSNSSITKRRNAVYRPSAKEPTDPVPGTDIQQGAISVTKPVSKRSQRAKSLYTEALTVVAPTNAASNVVLTNITNRRMTRKQSQLLAAYTGSGSSLNAPNITERRSTNYFQRTSVLFTMIDTKQYKHILQKYNIFVADINEKYDYVITERICRSPKFLSAVVSGKPILSINWLHALNEKKVWLDPLTYLLKDDNGEKEYNFKLSATLLKATNKRLFDNYSILVTPHTAISPDSLKGVIFSGGGKFLKTTLVPRRGDEVICISDEVDKKMWPTLQLKYPTLRKIISLDGFSKMIFQYTHDVSSADILHQI